MIDFLLINLQIKQLNLKMVILLHILEIMKIISKKNERNNDFIQSLKVTETKNSNKPSSIRKNNNYDREIGDD